MKDAKKLSEELSYKKKTVYEAKDEAHINAAYDFSRGYAAFLDACMCTKETQMRLHF